MTAWNADTEADIGGADAVTLVEGSSFCISAHSGDISAEGGTNGAFYQDTRVVSRWILRINGALREAAGGAPARRLRGHLRGPRPVAGRPVRQSPGGPSGTPRGTRASRTTSPWRTIPRKMLTATSNFWSTPTRLISSTSRAAARQPGADVRRSASDGELRFEAVRNGQRRGTAIRAAGPKSPDVLGSMRISPRAASGPPALLWFP